MHHFQRFAFTGFFLVQECLSERTAASVDVNCAPSPESRRDFSIVTCHGRVYFFETAAVLDIGDAHCVRLTRKRVWAMTFLQLGMLNQSRESRWTGTALST